MGKQITITIYSWRGALREETKKGYEYGPTEVVLTGFHSIHINLICTNLAKIPLDKAKENKEIRIEETIIRIHRNLYHN